MAENRAPKRLKHCDTGEKATLKRSRTEDEEEEAPATKIQQRVPAGPDLEEDSGSSNSNKFDVFISHRGPDTKCNMAHHMYDLLQAKGIRAFLDKKELQSGERFSEAIEEAIKLSTVHVCILSSGYAESVWCLKELEKMIYKSEMGESKLIPVFYDVEPFEVRYLKGAFGQGFQKLVDKDRYSMEIIDQWKSSLDKIAQISGIKGKGESCKKIVKMICKLLFDDGSVATSQIVVGIQKELCRVKDDIMKRRKEGRGVTSVEISGIGGIGKTTFAKELYNMIHRQYERSCFIGDVNGLVEKHGVNEVHRQLISKLFSFDSSYLRMEGKKLLSDRLNGAEFLVVLDNIHSKLPLSYVFIEDDVFPSKESLIIVTSREKGVLQQDGRVAHFYQNLISLQIPELSFPISKQIFCEYAFRGIDNGKNEFNELIDNIVRKCHGVPLALISLGNVVRGKGIKSWRKLWNSVKDSLFQDVKMILKLSYDNLETKLEKCLFLDVATFFRGENEKLLARLRSSDDESKVFWALEILERKLLIDTDSNGLLNMHDLLVDLGKSIIKDDSLCPGGSRVWHPRDVRDVLSEEMGTEKVTALSLVSNGSPVLDECGDPWSTEAFSKLPSLEFLILHGPCIQGNDFSKFSKKLLWLKWTNFPYDHIPETLCIKRLRALHLSSERLTWLWERSQQETPAKLRELILSYCKNLKRLPEFNERFLHLSCLKLEECRSLVTLPNSFGRLQGLKHLQLSGCNVLERLPDAFGDLRNLCKLEMLSLERLKSLPGSFGNLSQLERLDIYNCNALQCLPESFGNLSQLERLNIYECNALQCLPESFGNLSQLERLDIYECNALQCLPGSFGNLSQLKRLYIYKCNALQCLPESFGNLSQLERLDIERCNALQCLAESFGNLSQLKGLTMSDCGALQQLPKSFENLSRLESLDMSTCWALQSLPASFDRLLQLKTMVIHLCEELRRLPESFGNLRQLQHLDCSDIHWLKALQCLPESFGNLSQVNKLSIIGCIALQCLPESFGKLLRLEQLEIRECSALQRLPESFGNLSQVNKLSIIGCIALQCLPESFGKLLRLEQLEIHECSALQRLPESFGNLSQVNKLRIIGCLALQCLPESFGKLLRLEQLEILECSALQRLPESFGNLSQVNKLRIIGCIALQCLPESFGKLLRLEQLKIRECSALQRLPESFGNLSQVNKLSIIGCIALQCLPESFGKLLRLEQLKIRECSALQRLPESFGNLSQVNKLSIIGCIALQCLPESFGKLLRLEQLEIRECSALQRLPESFGNLSQVNKLSIIGCIALQCLPESFGKLSRLQWLKIYECSALQRLPESFGNLLQLKSLTIKKCRALQCLPESFIHLQQLQKLSMEDLFDITGLPETFGCLTNLLQLSIIGCTGMEGLPESFGHFPQLQVLEIKGCSGLEGLPKSFECLTKLVELKVNHCHKIKLLADQFQWLLGIPELSIMEIAYSSFGQNAAVEQQNIDCWKNSKRHGQDTQHQHLISLVHEVTGGTQAYSEHAAPPPSSNVELIANHFLQELPQSLSASQHIKILHLHHCHSLQKLPDIIGSLSRLTELDLNSCLNLRVLPACIENLSRLKRLSLISCWNLKEFPDTIGNLKNLEHLGVIDCIVLKGLAFQSGSFPNLVSFTVKHCWMVEVIDIHALVRLSCFEVDACVNLRSIAGLSGLPQLRNIRIQGCLNLKDIVPGDINGCASWSSLNILEISGCYQLPPPCEGLVQLLPHELVRLRLSLNHDIISRASLDNQTETMPASLINWSLNAKVQGLSPSRVVNAKTNPALFPVVEQKVTHLLSTKHDSFSSSTSSFSFYKSSQLRARSSSSSTSSFFFHKFPLLNGNIKTGVVILCFVSVVGTVDSPMHVPPPQTVFSMNNLVQSASFDFGEEIHMATFRYYVGFDLEHMYIEVRKGTDYWPSYEAIVKEGWIILLPGGQGEKGNEQNESLAAEILNIFYSELRKQRFMSRAWTQLPSQLQIFEFSALDIAGCQITKASRHCNTCIMEEETGLTWKRRRCLFVDDHALLLQHPRSSSRHTFLPYPGLHPNLEGGGVLANLYEMSICMLVKGKVVHSTKLQEMVGINQVEIPGDLNTLLQRNASRSTFETLHRKRSEVLRGEAYTRLSFSHR